MGFLSGKRILITGVASKLSIAYGIAHAMQREGAELAFTYQNDKLKSRVEEFAASLDSSIVLPCDVAEDTSIESLFSELAKVWPTFDGFVHSIGFAPADNPHIAFAVLVEGDDNDPTPHGGDVAGPIARALLEAGLQ